MLSLAAVMLVLQVTVDGRSMVTGLPMPAILGEVRELWKPYLDIVFRDDSDTEPACGRALRLLIVDQVNVAANPAHQPPSLGWIEFVGEEQPAQAITVSAHTARVMLKEGRWLGRRLAAWPPGLRQTFLTRALGRAIAHEIGHFVLRSTAHSAAGLMRPRFTVADIMDSRRAHFRLGRDERARLTARLAAPEWTQPTAATAADHSRSARLGGHAFQTGQPCLANS